MTPEQWHRIEQVCLAALEKPRPARPQFLADACGNDTELRAQVERLIDSYEETGSFLEMPLRSAALRPVAENETVDHTSETVTVGQMVSHYRITDKLGAGGMGVVYRAYDGRLERDVAIKLLPPGTLADEKARRRFRKEALTVSKINHPNIETVHDFDTEVGIDFLVMEYVAGTTLSDKLSNTALPEHEVIALGTQLLQGLAAAHEQGVLHCDLKPGNLRVTRDGRLKILDFGLARLLRPASELSTSETVTNTYAVAGTLPFMAPEQLLGQALDVRTDIYSAGAVFYEMATGQRLFADANGPALVNAILHLEPRSPRVINARLSQGMENLILRCLEKKPERRYQAALEILSDLGKIASGMKVPGRRSRKVFGSLAVLPFENVAGDPEMDYFNDGVTETLVRKKH